MAGNSQSVDGLERNALTLEGLAGQMTRQDAAMDRRMDTLERQFAELLRRLPSPPHLKEEEARSRKREAQIQKVETWINSVDTFHTLTEIKVEPRKIQKIPTPMAPQQSSSTPMPLEPTAPPPPSASLPPPSKPATPVLPSPDDIYTSIFLEVPSKHEKEDFSPPIDPFDSGPIWDTEEERNYLRP